MPFQCVVSGCYSLAIPKKISLFEFPSDLEKQKRWIHFVASKNKRWRGCTSSSRICSDHFHRSDFHNFKQFKNGCAKNLKLKNKACPSIYPEDTAFRAKTNDDDNDDDKDEDNEEEVSPFNYSNIHIFFAAYYTANSTLFEPIGPMVQADFVRIKQRNGFIYVIWRCFTA